MVRRRAAKAAFAAIRLLMIGVRLSEGRAQPIPKALRLLMKADLI